MSDIFAMIADERRTLATEVESLTPAQWESPSSMPGWKVKHVVAHLVWPLDTSLAMNAFYFLRNGFNFAKTADYVAAKETRSAKELAGVLRSKADSKFTPPGLPPAAPLTDMLVHTVDILRPLGQLRKFPDERVQVVLNHLVKSGNMKFFGTPKDFTFVAEDVPWSEGTGPKVSGKADVLLHALTGRKCVVDQLKGEGSDAFRAAFKEYV